MPKPRSTNAAGVTSTTSIVGPLPRRPISSRTQQKPIMIGCEQLLEGVNATISGKRKADASPLRNDKVKRSALGNLTNAVLNINIDNDAKKSSKNMLAKSDAAQRNREVVVAKKALPTGAKVNINNQKQVLPSLGHGKHLTAGVPVVAPVHRPAKVMTRAASRATQPISAKEVALAKTQRDAAAAVAEKPRTNEIAASAFKPKRKTDVGATNAGGNCAASQANSNDAKTNARRISIEIDQTENDESSLYMSASEDL